MAHLITEIIQFFLFTDDDFPDNQSSLEFHLKVFTSSVDLRPKSPSEYHCVLVKPISLTLTQIRLPLQKVGILEVYIMYTSTVHLQVLVQLRYTYFVLAK